MVEGDHWPRFPPLCARLMGCLGCRDPLARAREARERESAREREIWIKGLMETARCYHRGKDVYIRIPLSCVGGSLLFRGIGVILMLNVLCCFCI